MYRRLYYHPEQKSAAEGARAVTVALFAAFDGDPALMGDHRAAAIPDEPTARARTIADYIAGMTDRFALAAYARVTGTTPSALSNV